MSTALRTSALPLALLAVGLASTTHAAPAPAEPPPDMCNDASICWEHPRPQGNALLALWASSERDVWLAGSAGTLLHFDGAKWARVTSGTGASLRAVWGSGSGDVWAAGDAGTLVQVERGAARVVAGPARAGLRALYGTAANDVWAAGERGTLLHFDGAAWSEAPTGGRELLLGVGGTGARDVWAVGAGGVILHFDGAGWTRHKSGTSNALHAVWARAANDVWAVAGNGPNLHFDGSEWKPVARGAEGRRFDLFGAARLGASTAGDKAALLAMDWCGGLQRVAAGDRVELTGVPALSLALVPAPKVDHDALVGLPSSVVGAPPRGCAAGEPLPVIRALALSGNASGSMGFAGGDAGALFRLGSNGVWVRGEVPGGAAVRGLAIPAPGVAWAAAGSSLLRWDGASWSEVKPARGTLAKEFLEAVWARGTGELWVVGSSGKVLRRDAKGAFFEVRSGTTMPLTSIWGSDGPIFIAGGEERAGSREAPGIVLAWDGRRLARATTASAPLAAVSGSGRTDVWAAGARGTLLHYDGKRWSPSKSGVTEDLTALWVASPTEAWAAGKAGTLLRFNGATWSLVDSGTRNHLYAIAGDQHVVRVAGMNATILAVPRTR